VLFYYVLSIISFIHNEDVSDKGPKNVWILLQWGYYKTTVPLRNQQLHSQRHTA